MTAPFTVALDCDGVLFDFVRAFQTTYDEGLPHDLKLGDYWQPDQWDISKSHPLRGAGLTSALHLELTYARRELGQRVQPYPYASDMLRELHETGARIVFATAPLYVNYEWVYHRHAACSKLCRDAGVPPLPVVFAADKTLVAADLLIDDCAANVREFEATGRIGLLFDQPYNRAESVPFRAGADGLVVFVTEQVARRR